MTNRINVRTGIKASPRWIALALLLGLGGLCAVAVPTPQEVEDETRRLWHKQFENVRGQTGS